MEGHESPDADSFDPFSIFHVKPQKCHLLYVTVKCGRKITKGKMLDYIDTPDPYIRLKVPTSGSPRHRTSVRLNTASPEWNEKFKFVLDENKNNTLSLELWESDYVSDDLVGKQQYDLDQIKVGETKSVTVIFNEISELDLEIERQECDKPDLRQGLTLDDGEKAFLANRKKKVFEAMNDVFGEEGPDKVSEVPVIGVLGSGGGFRAMVGFSGVMSMLEESGILDMVTYAAGLSGSTWLLSYLYANPEWPQASASKQCVHLKERISKSWVKLSMELALLRRFMALISDKRQNRQPLSFTDWFGHLLGDLILKEQMDSRLSHQADKVKDGSVPMPIYTSIRVKSDVSAAEFHEWVEYTPFEVSMPKYGVSLPPSLFNSRFYMGRLVDQCPEPQIHYLLGIWGSAFTILFSRLTNSDSDQEEVTAVLEETATKKKEEKEVINDKYSDDEDDEEEDLVTDSEDMSDQMLPAPVSRDEVKQSMAQKLLTSCLNSNMLNTRQGRAATVLNCLYGVTLLRAHAFSPFSQDECRNDDHDQDCDTTLSDKRTLMMVDAGLSMNLPMPPLLRPQRNVDLLLSFDFSLRDSDDAFPFTELLNSEEWARKRNVPFPPITVTPESVAKEGIKECYVFRDPQNDLCPIVVHFVLINDSYRKKKGDPEETEGFLEDEEFRNFSVFGDENSCYSTFNFTYPERAMWRLHRLMAHNTKKNVPVIHGAIIECINRRRKRSRAASASWEIARVTSMASRGLASWGKKADVNTTALERMSQLIKRTSEADGATAPIRYRRESRKSMPAEEDEDSLDAAIEEADPAEDDDDEEVVVEEEVIPAVTLHLNAAGMPVPPSPQCPCGEADCCHDILPAEGEEDAVLMAAGEDDHSGIGNVDDEVRKITAGANRRSLAQELEEDSARSSPTCSWSCTLV